MSEEHARRLSAIPSVDRLLAAPWARALAATHARRFVVECIRAACDELRRAIAEGAVPHGDLEREIERRAVAAAACVAGRPPLETAVNATGVCLHTNLGRALLPEEAVEALVAAARFPAALELDLETGERGERDSIVEADLCALTGAEAATVVNNNAGAVLLALNALADGREVVVSRGELVEIGGSFRIPDVMAKSGARLREVGSTNRTHPADYERAIGADTAALLKVHTSNYRIVGFTAEVPLEELVALARPRGLLVLEDLGSGALVDLTAFGLPPEPVVADRVAKGADVVAFSGDKLLGGPQAGILVGRRAAIERIRRDPLRRALRPGKLVLAALSAVLRLYRRSPDLGRDLPTLRWLSRSLSELDAVAADAAARLREALGPGYAIDVAEDAAEVGSGALPTATVPSRVVRIAHPTESASRIAARFRRGRPPIVGRVRDGRFLLDVRGVREAAELVPR